VDFSIFDIYQGILSAQTIDTRIQTFLERSKEIRRHYWVDGAHLYVGDQENYQVDYVLRLAPEGTPFVAKERVCPGLAMAKIAIDPGHFGGPYAHLEERFIDIPAQDGHPALVFDEGSLTYWTALELQALLEAAGAETMITFRDWDRSIRAPFL